MKRFGLFVRICLLVAPSIVYAGNFACETLPSCDDLGYQFTKAQCKDTDNNDLPMLVCPFDSSKFYCKKKMAVPCKVGNKYTTVDGFNDCNVLIDVFLNIPFSAFTSPLK